jgi:DNA (cytosine-5)-methyltransferase 1
MPKKLTAVSVFSGCGGFDFGLQTAGVKILWANDIDPPAGSAYKSLFPKTEFVLGDIKKIKEIPEADILIGCYPCTGFSEAARRKWKHRKIRDHYANDKNFLFREFLRVIDIVRPKAIFIENVRGMVSAEDGYFFKRQLNGFKRKGFRKLEYLLLDASNYGVAQTRKRIFIVGYHDDLGDVKYNFPEPTHGMGKAPLVTLSDAIGHMDAWPEGEFYDAKFHGHYLTRNRKREWEQPSFTIVANAHHVPLHPMGEPMKQIGKDKWTLNGRLNRRLSWREGAIIQGLPETIEIDGSLTDKYMVIGNSVPPKLSYSIVRNAAHDLRRIL